MAETTQYIVQEGERWDGIAQKAYGRAAQFKEIIEANPLVSITTRLPAGTVLNIPLLDTTPKTDLESLPPWKRDL